MSTRGRIYPTSDARVIALREAIRNGGGLTKVSHALGIKIQSLYNWEMCPPNRCMALSELSGVSVHRLRPDVFGNDQAEARRAG